VGQQSGRHAKASAAHRKRNKGKGKGKAGGSGSGGGGGSGGKARRSLELQEQQAELERAADCGDVETIRTLAAAGADLDGTGALGLTALVRLLLTRLYWTVVRVHT